MAQNSRITFVTDPEVKRKAAELAREMGTNTSNILNMFLHAFVRTSSIPFEISLDSETPAERAEINKALAASEAEASDPGTVWLSGDEVKNGLF